jgi:hypothetical protein
MMKPEVIEYFVAHDTRHDKITIESETYGE